MQLTIRLVPCFINLTNLMLPCRQEDGDGEPEDIFSDMDSVPGDEAGLEGLSVSSFNMELM